MGGCTDDHAAWFPGAVEDEHRLSLEAFRVEGLGPAQPDFLRGGQQDFEVAGRWLLCQIAQQEQEHGDGRLVVGAENGLAVGAHDAVLADDSGCPVDGDRVDVRTERHGEPVLTAADANEQVARGARAGGRGVLVHTEPQVLDVLLDEVRHLALLARGRADSRQSREQVAQIV